MSCLSSPFLSFTYKFYEIKRMSLFVFASMSSLMLSPHAYVTFIHLLILMIAQSLSGTCPFDPIPVPQTWIILTKVPINQQQQQSWMLIDEKKFHSIWWRVWYRKRKINSIGTSRVPPMIYNGSFQYLYLLQLWLYGKIYNTICDCI